MSLYCLKCGVETETKLACDLCNKTIKAGDYWHQKIMRAWHKFIIEQSATLVLTAGIRRHLMPASYVATTSFLKVPTSDSDST